MNETMLPLTNIKEATLELTQRCLNRCIYCSSCSTPYTTKHTLSYLKIVEILEELKTMGVKQLNLSGGEPFLHPDIMGIIEKASALGFNIYIYSSGLYTKRLPDSGEITPADYESIPSDYIKACKKAGIKKIIFNMQTTEEEMHSKITGIDLPQSFRDISIRESLNAGIDTEVNVVPMKINLDIIPQIVDKIIGLGCDKVNLLGLVLQGRAIQHKEDIVMNDVEDLRLKRIIEDLDKKYGNKVRIGSPLSGKPGERCYAGSGRISIRYDGFVFPCEAFKYKSNINGIKPLNVNDVPLLQIVQESEYLKLITEEIKCNKNANCADCPAQQDLGFKCAYDGKESGLMPDYLAQKAQSSKEIFRTHMLGALERDNMEIIKVPLNIVKDNPDIKEYLSRVTSREINPGQNIFIMMDKVSRHIKMACLESIRLSKDAYEKSRVQFPTIIESDSDTDEYRLLLPPYIIDDNISDENINKFYDLYIESATYPDKDFIKHTIIKVHEIDLKFRRYLNEKGFIKVSYTTITELHNMGYYTFEYVVAKQFCRDNIRQYL